ncbi:MAG: glycosyltransferase family 39 protein, partial [Candidatus Aureabacteria bacterium]|nr:glycosyltransferase family 39 protein [Candidatus Auribacterota bacterium]
MIIFLLIGLVYRFSAVYPSSPTRFAPASCALQSCWIYEGDRPIFYSGQAWMGPAGNYLIAIMYKIFGISSLTLSLFAWLMSALYYLLTVFLAFRLFGKGTALCTALLFMIPNVRLMYLAGQPRSHYELCFVLTPLVFLMTLSLLDRFRDGKTVLLYSLLLGFLSGFAFWNNMSIGPAIAVCVLVLWIRLKRQFFKPWLLLYICGGLIGFSPVIYYNLTTEMVLTGQANVNNAMNFFSVLKAFITNALPYFWEIQFRKMSNPVLVYVSIAFLVWIGILYLIVFIEGVKKAWKKEDWLGYGVLFGYLMGHLLITSVSSYGKRFAEGSNPISYIINLYTVAFTIPAVIASYKWKVWKKLILLFPFCFYLVNNSVHTFHYPKLFYSTLKEKGWSSVTRYPDPDNPLLGFFSKHDLKAGYIGRSLHAGSGSIRGMNFLFNLECFGKISFADFSSERYLPYA